MNMPVKLAIYDMDKTLTRRPTFTPFLLHAVVTRAPWRLFLAPLLIVTGVAYGLRLIDRGRLKVWNAALLVGHRLSPAEVTALSDSFAARTVLANLLPAARAQLDADRADGWRIVIATASYAHYSRAIGRALGIADTIGTDVRVRTDGSLTTLIEGENCYGPVKRQMVEAWMAREHLTRADCRIRFYSDHVSDAPMFEFADEPVAVNAHGPLRALAKARGWRVEDWR